MSSQFFVCLFVLNLFCLFFFVFNFIKRKPTLEIFLLAIAIFQASSSFSLVH